MSWLTSLRNLFSSERPAMPLPPSMERGDFVAMCQEDPEQARAMLAADQRSLAQAIEGAYQAYDAKLRDLATRLRDLTPEQLVTEATKIREAQDALRIALRRLDASARKARELERELADWEDRDDESVLHADHPKVRAEIVRSELAVRQASRLEDRHLSDVKKMIVGKPVVDHIVLPKPVEAPKPEVYAVQINAVDPVRIPDEQHLVAAIRDAVREASRWHGAPEMDHEAVQQVHQVRALHGLLKQLDRQQGKRRDRLELAIPMKEIY